MSRELRSVSPADPGDEIGRFPVADASPESIAAAWDRIDSRESQTEFLDGNEQSQQLARLAMQNMESKQE